MTKSDLHRAYARVIDMCRNTPVKPHRCVRRNGDMIAFEPTFTASGEYTFAFAIVHGRPIFIGDKVWSITFNRWVEVTGMEGEYALGTTCNPPHSNVVITNVRWEESVSEYGIIPVDERYNIHLYAAACYDVNIVLVKDGISGKFRAEVTEVAK